tara:strand:- start:116 stop:559 length:444 start_codon:yes stop_codon:yes gene_type:complete
MTIEKINVEISELKLDQSIAKNFVSSNSHGACTIFEGVTRDHSDNRKVKFLEYECYKPMAIKKLKQICEEIIEKWDVKVSILHRIGKLEIGEVSLIVATGSPHRKEGIQACEYSVDRIKEIVPIWKKEFFEGGSIWIEDENGFRPFS